MRIRHMMHDNPAVVGPEVSFATLLLAYRDMDSRLVYVTAPDRRLMGVVSSYDLLRVMLPFYLDSNLAKALSDDDETLVRQSCLACQALSAADIMTRTFVSIGPDDTFLEAEALIAERGVNVLPVLDADGRLVGEMTRRRILKYLAGHCGLDNEA
jgi:CBS domain-containing protein